MEKTNKRILIIDDDHNHSMAAKEILENEGYRVSTHDQALGSSALVRETKPDLVLLDINMPAHSGDKLPQKMCTNTNSCEIPILFYSSNDEDSLRRAVSRNRSSQVKGYICKGNPHELRRKVAYWLSGN